jgi:iron complex transport system ATP-binding protein
MIIKNNLIGSLKRTTRGDTMLLEVKNIKVGYGKKTVLENFSFKLRGEEILCILGANGVGKTTLYNAILGFTKLKSGSITLDETDISKWSRKEFAKQVAYVPQINDVFFPYEVIDVVVMGRNPYLGRFEQPSHDDYEIAMQVLGELGIEHLENKSFTELSGGERQLVLIARALTQEPKLLIMDEPTASLDFGNSIKLLSKIIKLKKDDIGILITTHSPHEAAAYATKVLMIKDGRVYKYGEAEKVINNKLIHQLYNINSDVIIEPELKKLLNVCV